MIAAWHLLAPHDPELIAAHLLSPLSDGLGPGRNAAVTAVRGVATLAGTVEEVCPPPPGTGLARAPADGRVAGAGAWRPVGRGGRAGPRPARGGNRLGVAPAAPN